MSSKHPKKQRLMETPPKVSPKPILGAEFTQQIPLHDAFIGVLRSKKTTAASITRISSILPGFRHLKRCSGDRLLLSFVGPPKASKKASEVAFASAEDLKSFLKSSDFPLDLLQEDFEVLKVPERASRTKIQCKEASASWPQNFHPDPQIESLLSGSFFSFQQLEVIESCMRVCIKAAEKCAIGNEFCNGSVVVLDPNAQGNRILAVAAAKVDENPMFHAAMLGIDLIARKRGGSAWKLLTSSLESAPLVYPEELEQLEIPEFSEELYRDNEDEASYLCTNYWVFLVEEPCALCAMALLHSRVSNVFYGVSSGHGVLGSRAMLHTLPNLNHRYKVWAEVLEDECRGVVGRLKTIRS